jgi:hypothetical protein
MNNIKMRAKLVVTGVAPGIYEGKTTNEVVSMRAVAKNDAYPEDGSDEDNTYAKFSPSANFEINIANPNLFGKFAAGQKFYVDFTPAES